MPLLSPSRALQSFAFFKTQDKDFSIIKFLSLFPCSINNKHSSAVINNSNDQSSLLVKTLSAGWQAERERRALLPFAAAEASHHSRNFIVSCERGPAHSSGIEKCAQAKNVFIFDLNIVEVLFKNRQEWQDSHPKAVTGGGGTRRWVSFPSFPRVPSSRDARPALAGRWFSTGTQNQHVGAGRSDGPTASHSLRLLPLSPPRAQVRHRRPQRFPEHGSTGRFEQLAESSELKAPRSLLR